MHANEGGGEYMDFHFVITLQGIPILYTLHIPKT